MSISVKPASLRRFLRGVDFISLSTYPRWVGLTRPWTIFGSLATFRQALNCPSGRPLHPARLQRVLQPLALAAFIVSVRRRLVPVAWKSARSAPRRQLQIRRRRPMSPRKTAAILTPRAARVPKRKLVPRSTLRSRLPARRHRGLPSRSPQPRRALAPAGAPPSLRDSR